jgi:hypothetical protein
MDVVICSSMSKSCLLHSTTSSDYALGKAENIKFTKDLRNVEPIQLSATMRFIPLAMNQFGKRGPHFDALLREMASVLIKRPAGCGLLQGPFAIPPTVALGRILASWGARLTWAAQREHAAQIVRAVETHKTADAFCASTIAHFAVGHGHSTGESVDHETRGAGEHLPVVDLDFGNGFDRAGEAFGWGPAG